MAMECPGHAKCAVWRKEELAAVQDRESDRDPLEERQSRLCVFVGPMQRDHQLELFECTG